jgi:hypothetical protein
VVEVTLALDPVGFVGPGFALTAGRQFKLSAHGQHVTVAIIALLPCSEHGATEALRDLAGVA